MNLLGWRFEQESSKRIDLYIELLWGFNNMQPEEREPFATTFVFDKQQYGKVLNNQMIFLYKNRR